MPGPLKHTVTYVTSTRFVFLGSKDGDLRDFRQVEAIFEKHKPTYVIHLAARVGGLFANMQDKVGFYEDNMAINLNVVKCCHQFKVKTLLSALSTCIYPDNYRPSGWPAGENYAMVEADIHKGPPHPSNEGYAYAKRMLEMHSRIYNEQHGTDFRCFVPTNLYGKHDVYG